MFTGIVEEVGIVKAASRHRLTVGAKSVLNDLRLGDSIAVSGACLTAVEIDAEGFTVDLSEETIDRTNLGVLRPGGAVNLERAMRADGRLGGHMVQGHVDGVGTVVSFDGPEEGRVLRVEAPRALLPYIVEKGFIAVDGISLTVTGVSDSYFTIAVIPYTWRHTALRHRRPGDGVNIEVDILAKYLERLLAAQRIAR
ncbi:MAG: riboflavin synthase [SAR202 cluster bacterium]|nr:riboflavin synthase [SAR202 cluster bacterium]